MADSDDNDEVTTYRKRRWGVQPQHLVHDCSGVGQVGLEVVVGRHAVVPEHALDLLKQFTFNLMKMLMMSDGK